MPPAVPLRQAVRLAALAGRGLLLAHFALLLVQGLVPLLGLLAMQQLLDAVHAGLAGDRAAASPRVAVAVAFAAAVAALGAILRAHAAQVGERHARLVADRSAQRLQEHAAGLDLLQLEDPANADLLHRASAEATQRPAQIVQDLAGFVLALVTFLALGGVLATLTPVLPLCVGAAAVPLAIARLRHARALFAWQTAHTESQREAVYLGGLLTGRFLAKDLRLFDLGPRLAAELAARRANLTDDQLALSARRSWQEALAQIVASLALFLAYLHLAFRTLDGALTIGGLLLHAQAVQRAQNGIRDGLLAWSGLRAGRLFLAHVSAFLALAPRVTAPARPRAVPVRPAQGLGVEGATFCYPGGAAPVLRGVDFTLRMGERVALVGPNGAGKSTIVRLLCRLCDPDAGAVRYGGTDLREFDPVLYRAQLSVFFQDAAGLEFSARRNLALGAPGSDDAALLDAADLVGLRERLLALPQGLDTRLGRGFRGAVELSAGEWRRLLLARALARPAAVLLLDEPFAFLDPKSQARLQRALEAAPRDRIVLVIDQRPQALGWVDRVLVCEQGRIVAEGPPAAVPGV